MESQRRGHLMVACLLAGTALFAAEPKKVLVFSRCEGFNHTVSIKMGNELLKSECAKMGYAVDFNNEYAALKLDNLKKYDVLVLNNTTHMKTKQNGWVSGALIDFVRNGGGLTLIHAALDNFYDADDCSYMGGGRFNGHPWCIGGNWKFRLEDRDNPVAAMFSHHKDGLFFKNEEVYQHFSPFYDREKLRVLISLDLSDPATAARPGQKRADKDYAVSWIRRFGKGRVFYTTFAHDNKAWEDAERRAHIFAGLKYTAGDLKADDTPRELTWAQATNAQKCSLLYTYAARGEGAKVAEHLEDENVEVAKAAALALGRLGCPKALAALAAIKPSSDPSLADARACALAAAFGQAVRRGDAKGAAAVAKSVYDNAYAPDFLRAAAARVLVKADAANFKCALASDVKLVRQSALMSADEVPAATLAAALAEAKCPCMKVQLLGRIAANKATAASAEVAKLVKDENEDVAAAAVDALVVIGGDNLVATFAEARARGGRVQAAADTALAEMGGIGEQILAFAEKDPSFLNIALGRGEMKLLPKWTPLVSSSDVKTRKATWRALGKAAAKDELPTMLGWFGKVGAEEAEVAVAAMGRVVRRLDAADRDSALCSISRAASATTRDAVNELVWEQKGVDAFAFWEKGAAKCPAAKAAYVKYAEKLARDASFSKVDRAKWTVSANRDEGSVKNAIDGNPGSRWTSGMDSKNAEFILNFGAKLFVEEVTLDTAGSPRDTPYGCDVFASDDGKSWKKVASCDDKTVNSTTFRINAATQQLKFVNLERRPNLHWSIHEINVKAEVDKKLLEKIAATAKAFGAK